MSQFETARPSRAALLAVPPSALLRAMRPRQWIKNGLLFVALAFTLNIQHADLLLRTLVACASFCALSSAGYLFNDILDVESDRLHPTKRTRPIASGALPVSAALFLALLLAVLGSAGCFAVRPLLGAMALLYLGLTIFYTVTLKHLVLLDVFGLAAGFVLRAAAGAVAINVPISPWLYTATMLGALLIALGKRRAELASLGDQATSHRRNLAEYTPEFVDQLILIISSAAVMTYALYTFSAENLPADHSMMLTLPLVLYGLFRYLLLIRQGPEGGAPEDLLLHDRPLLLSVVLWALGSVVVLYAHGGPG